MMDAADREIYEAAMSGDRDAFEDVIRALGRQLFAIAYGILQNREEAEDVVQDTFVKAWKSQWRVRDAGKFPAWIATIARHRAHDVLRRRRSVPLDEEVAEAALAETESVDVHGNAERAARVHRALASLPELHRAAVALRYLEGMDYAAIEQALSLSNGALRGILGRALAAMRKELKPALAAMG